MKQLLEGRPAGSWVASCARAPRGGDNVLLIDWVSWAECRNLQKGDRWRGGMTEEDSQSTSRDSLTSVSDLCPFDLHCGEEDKIGGNAEVAALQ